MKTKWKNSPLAFPNNSTIFALNLILSYFSVSRPLSTRLGAFSFPRNIFPQIFSEIFSTQGQADFFLYFWREKLCFLGANFFLLLWREKLWGLNLLSAPRMGGGIPFCMPIPHIAKGIRPACLHPLRSSIFSLSGQIFGKKWQKLEFICSLWCFLGILGDSERQKPKLFLKSRHNEGARWCVPCLLSSCPLGAGCRASGAILLTLAR